MFLTDRKLERRIAELKEHRYRDIINLNEFTVQEDTQGVVNPVLPEVFPLGRYLNLSMHPKKKITSFPCIPYTQCIPSCKDFRQYRIHNSLSIFLYCKFIEIYNISISVDA